VHRSVAAAVRGAVAVVALVACNNVNVPPHQGTAFRPELLGRLSIGMPEADIITLMGPPLRRELLGQGPQGRQMLTYAESGAWIKGDVSIHSTGYDCLLWLHGGRLDEVFFFNTTTWRKCQCSNAACPPKWAAPCQPSAP
jgi:hypothetical protein